MNGKQAKKIRKLVTDLCSEPERKNEMRKMLKRAFMALSHRQKKTSSLFSRA